MPRLSPRWRKIWADLKVNRTRTALVVMSIVVGIFAIGAISGTFAILGRETKELWQGIDPASGVIASTIFDQSLADQIAALPEVETIQLRRSTDVSVALNDGSIADLRIYAVPDYTNMQLNRISPESGEWPPMQGGLLIERSTLDLVEARIGGGLSVKMSGGSMATLEVTGETYDLSLPSGTVQGIAYGYVTMATMQRLTGQAGFNELQFRVAENADDEAHVVEVGNMIRDLMENQGQIVFSFIPLPTDEPPAYMFVVALLLVLGVIGSLTFLLSGFLIINIISALLAQQTKQIGVMKAIGARTGQIVRMYLGMAMAYGLIALLIGLPLSYLGARGLSSLMGNLSNYKITDFSAPWYVFALQIVIGLLVPVLAALIPVYLGTRTTIREALDSRGIDAGASNSFLNRILAKFQGLPRPVLLSFRNTFRQRGRLALTLLTLTLAGAIFATVFTIRSSLYNTLDDALGYEDYDLAIDLQNAYPADELKSLTTSIENVATVETWTQAIGRYEAPNGQGGNASGMSGLVSSDITLRGLPADSTMIQPIIEAGRWLQDGDQNALVINRNLADSIGEVQIGDNVDLIVRGQPTTWEIVGIAQAVFSFESQAWTTTATLNSVIGEPGQARALRINLSQSDEASQNAAVTRISEGLGEAGFLVDGTETRAALQSSFDLRFNTLVVGLLALAGLLAVVGGLGIAGTTSINVIERMREIGIMRSIGAADYQVLGIFVIEALVVGIIGWVLGAILALPISKVLSDGVGNAFSNAPLTYRFDTTGMLLWLVLALALAAISSYLPSRRASKLTLREVLSYEG